MNLLAFDTSTDSLSIAVQRGGGALAQVWAHTGVGGAQASSTLIPAIQRLMKDAGLDFKHLDAIAFGRGPGSFTGLRTACSVAQGLAFGAGVPVLPVDSLLAMAEDARCQFAEAENLAARPAPARMRVLALLDARMDELYAACCEFEDGQWRLQDPCMLVKPENLALEFPETQAVLAEQGVILLAGNVFTAYGQRLPASPWPRRHALPTASAMLRLAPQLIQAGLALPAQEALPLYIRDKVAKTTQERLLEKSPVPAPLTS